MTGLSRNEVLSILELVKGQIDGHALSAVIDWELTNEKLGTRILLSSVLLCFTGDADSSDKFRLLRKLRKDADCGDISIRMAQSRATIPLKFSNGTDGDGKALSTAAGTFWSWLRRLSINQHASTQYNTNGVTFYAVPSPGERGLKLANYTVSRDLWELEEVNLTEIVGKPIKSEDVMLSLTS